MVAFRYATVHRQILTLVRYGLVSTFWPPQWAKQTDSRAQPHPANGSQLSINNFWSSIVGNKSGA